MITLDDLLEDVKRWGSEHTGVEPSISCFYRAFEELKSYVIRAESDNETLRAAIRNNAIANAEMQDKLQATESKLKLIDGVSQDAIDGGWTSYGLSSYAKSLEKNNAELHMRLNSLINPCEQTQQSNELYDDTHAKLNPEKVDHTFTHRFKNAMLDK